MIRAFGILLADLSRQEMVNAMRQGFHAEDGTRQVWLVLGGGAVICILLVALWFIIRAAQRRDVKRAKAADRIDYFARATAVTLLSKAETADLRAVAQRATLPYPATLLLSPANLAYGVHHASAIRPDAALADRMSQFCWRFFGCTLPEPDAGDAAPAAAAEQPA